MLTRSKNRTPNREDLVKKPEVNIAPAERVARVTVGVAAAAGGIGLLLAGGGWPIILLEILLVLIGLDLAVTGALGYCLLYKRLGYIPPSLRRSP